MLSKYVVGYKQLRLAKTYSEPLGYHDGGSKEKSGYSDLRLALTL